MYACYACDRGTKTYTRLLQTPIGTQTAPHDGPRRSTGGALDDDADGARAAPGGRAAVAKLPAARAVRVVKVPHPARERGHAHDDPRSPSHDDGHPMNARSGVGISRKNSGG